MRNPSLLASPEQGLQHALDWFTAACGRAGMKIGTRSTLQQSESFKYLGWYSPVAEGGIRMEHGLVKETSGSAWAVFTHRKVVSFKSVFVQSFPYFHGSCAMTERVPSQVQAAAMGFLRRVHTVWLRGEVRSCEICWNPECRVSSPMREIPPTLVRPCVQISGSQRACH